jgi:hypothetical protein
MQHFKMGKSPLLRHEALSIEDFGRKRGRGYPGRTDGSREFLDTPGFVFAEALGLSNDSFNKTRSARKVFLIYHFWLL